MANRLNINKFAESWARAIAFDIELKHGIKVDVNVRLREKGADIDARNKAMH